MYDNLYCKLHNDFLDPIDVDLAWILNKINNNKQYKWVYIHSSSWAIIVDKGI